MPGSTSLQLSTLTRSGLKWTVPCRSAPQTFQAELVTNAVVRRLKRRLDHLGLPPTALHSATAAERRRNERDADFYFGDRQLSERLRQLSVFGASLTEYLLARGPQMREFARTYAATRPRVDLPPAPVETVVYARAVDIVVWRMHRVDLLASRDFTAAVRSSEAEVPRIEH